MQTQVTSVHHKKMEERSVDLSLTVLGMAPEGAVTEM